MHVLSCVQLFLILWAVTPKVPLSMRFFRQEYWSGLPFLTMRLPPRHEMRPDSPALHAEQLRPTIIWTFHIQANLRFCC